MVVHHVARRAVDVAVMAYSASAADSHPFGLLIFSLTALVLLVALSFITYTLGHVLTTLCMIESPETSTYVPVASLPTNNSDDAPPAYIEDEDSDIPSQRPMAAIEEEVNLVRNKPITASIRATVRHLRAQGGFWSIFRGFRLYFIISMITGILTVILSFGARNRIMVAIANIVANVIVANLHMTWIHVVISDPSPRRWWRRLPTPAIQSWRRIAPAVALMALASQIVYVLPMLVVGAGNGRFSNPDYQPGHRDVVMTFGQISGALVLSIALYVLLEIPAMVVMTRVAASMLPEEDETIVPFDRTFGGKVTPSILGGEGKIDLQEAWRSFPWASRKRLLILCAKIPAVIMVVYMVFVSIFVLEITFLIGAANFAEWIKGVHGGNVTVTTAA